jgi:hypothetical protein
MVSIDNFITGEPSVRYGLLHVNIHEALRPNFFPEGRRVTYNGETYRVKSRSVGMILTDPGIPFDMLTLESIGPTVGEVWTYRRMGVPEEAYTFEGEGSDWRGDVSYFWKSNSFQDLFVIPKISFQNNLHIWTKQ